MKGLLFKFYVSSMCCRMSHLHSIKKLMTTFDAQIKTMRYYHMHPNLSLFYKIIL